MRRWLLGFCRPTVWSELHRDLRPCVPAQLEPSLMRLQESSDPVLPSLLLAQEFLHLRTRAKLPEANRAPFL